MHVTFIIVVASDKLLFFGLVRWSDTLWPQVRIIAILFTELRCLLPTLFIVGHGQVLVMIISLILEAMRIHHVHVLLKEALNLALIGLVIVNHSSVTRVYQAAVTIAMTIVFLLLIIFSS